MATECEKGVQQNKHLNAGWTKNWFGRGICLGMYAQAIKYIRYMQRTSPNTHVNDGE